MIDPTLLPLLACPRCDDRPPLADEGAWLRCTVCHWRYRVEDGIPNLLPDEALPPDENDER